MPVLPAPCRFCRRYAGHAGQRNRPMPVYRSDSQLYTCFQSLFSIIEAHDPTAAHSLLKSSLAITFRCSAPAAAITIDARKPPVQLYYGNNGVKPTIEVGLAADTLHCLLLGELRLTKALGSELLKVQGPIWKTMSLANLFHYAQQFYPDVLRTNGLPAECPSGRV